MHEIESFLLENEMYESDAFHLENFKIQVNSNSKKDVQPTLRLLNIFSLFNLINKPALKSDHILDLVITKSHHALVERLTIDTINTLSDLRSLEFQLPFDHIKVKSKHISFRKKNITFPVDPVKKLEGKFFITQADCHHTEISPCINCTVKLSKRLLRSCKNVAG